MLKLVFGLLVVALATAVWLLADTLGLPAWVAAWIAVAALALVVLLVAVELVQRRRNRVRAARRAAERSVLHQIVQNLRSRCEQASEALRQHNCDDLPWFVLLGPHGAGKTAALRSAGLSFREGLGPERFIAGGDVLPTENIRFLADERAVFVDTTGRYLRDVADHDDRREWLELLGLLRAQRPGRPLAGVVLTVSAAELAGGTSEDAAALGHTLRRRLDDIQREFAAVVPVYLLITRLDALAGLPRLLADDPGDRFGFVVALSGGGASAARRVAEGPLHELTLALERRAFARLGQTAAPEECGQLHRAPGLFARLADRTTALIAAVFPDHGEPDAPIWRGLFFASAGSTHPGPALDPDLQQVAREYHDPPQLADAAPPPLPRPLFLRALFAEQLPADAWIAAPTRRQRARLSARHAVRSVAVALAASVLFALSLGSARSNHQLLGEVHSALLAVERDQAGDPRPIAPGAIAPLQAVVRKLEAHDDDGAPWSLRWGLYQGDALREAAVHVYRLKTRERLIRPLVRRARESLHSVYRQYKDSDAALPAAQFWQAVDDLHLYMLLTAPGAQSTVFLRDDDQQRWLADALAAHWLDALGQPAQEAARAQAFCRHHVPTLVAARDELEPGDPQLIEGVRRILRNNERGQMWVDELAAREWRGSASVLLSSIASGAGWLTSSQTRVVHGAFTRAGWDAVRASLDCNDPGERHLTAARVIDGTACEDERRALYGSYYDRYIQEWTQFIAAIHVRSPEDYRQIEDQLSAMTISGTPGANALQRLFRVVADNAQLAEPDAEIAPRGLVRWTVATHRQRLRTRGGFDPYDGNAGGIATVSQVHDSLRGFFSYGHLPGDAAGKPPLSEYITALAKVLTPLSEYNQQRNDQSRDRAREYAEQVFELVNNQHLVERDARWKPVLKGILEPPIRGLLDQINRGQLELLTERWCSDVVIPFDKMRGCYPFTRNATCNATGEEVAQIFQPQNGTLWKLYGEELADRFPLRGDRYEPAAQGYGSRVKLNPAVAVFLTNARELGEVLFPFGATTPSFSFSIQFGSVPGAAEVQLIVDGGAPVAYNNSNRDGFQSVKWPGEGSVPGVVLKARTHQGWGSLTKDGYWGIFRLFEEGDTRPSGHQLLSEFRLDGNGAHVPLRIQPSDGFGNPLFGRLRPGATLMDVFRAPRLVPPRQLFIGGKSCKPAP